MTVKISPAWQITPRDRGRHREQPVQITLHIPSPDDIPPEYRRGPHGQGQDRYRHDDGEPYTFPMGGEDEDGGCTIQMC
jgi:hypothetical protein